MADNRTATQQAGARCSLYLHTGTQTPPADSECERLAAGLQTIGLTGKAIDGSHTRFYTGEKFLDYIAYMGCSPAITFEDTGDGNRFCHIRIHRYREPALIHSRLQARPPICPHCRKPVKDWQPAQGQIHCPHCDTASPAAAFNWRKMAGVSTLFIEITDIFPKEAIPQQLLLDRLAGIHPAKWRYFYSCQ